MLANIGAYVGSDRNLLSPFGMIGTVLGVYTIPKAYINVVGVLSNVHKADSGKLIQWEIGGAYPNNAMTAVIFKHDMSKFPDMTPMVGKTLAITGKIELYHDKPEIVLKDITQVQVAQ